MTDTERIDGLVRLAENGDCPALISDDNGHWAVVSDGFQNMPQSTREAETIMATFIVEAGDWFDDPRAAIDEYLRENLTTEESRP